MLMNGSLLADIFLRHVNLSGTLSYSCDLLNLSYSLDRNFNLHRGFVYYDEALSRTSDTFLEMKKTLKNGAKIPRTHLHTYKYAHAYSRIYIYIYICVWVCARAHVHI